MIRAGTQSFDVGALARREVDEQSFGKLGAGDGRLTGRLVGGQRHTSLTKPSRSKASVYGAAEEHILLERTHPAAVRAGAPAAVRSVFALNAVDLDGLSGLNLADCVRDDDRDGIGVRDAEIAIGPALPT